MFRNHFLLCAVVASVLSVPLGLMALPAYAAQTPTQQISPSLGHYDPAGGTAMAAAVNLDGPGYELQANGNTYARRDPCQVIDYEINANLGGPGAEADVHEAVRRVSAASGLQFRFLGLTNEFPQSNYGQAWSPTNRTPLLIAWGTPQYSDAFDHAPAYAYAYGGWRNGEWTDGGGHHPPQIVTGFVYVDASRVLLTPGFSAQGSSRGPLLMHELGHTVGLDHTSATGQIMSLNYDRPADWGDGDRAGLQRVGAAAGCMNPPAVGSLDNVAWQQTSASSGMVTVDGWAFDPNKSGAGQVQVYIDGQGADYITTNIARADVANAYNREAPAGFNASITTTNAMHTVCVYAISAAGGPKPLLGCAERGNVAPVGTLDSVIRSQTANGAVVTVTGWAFDPEGHTTVAVHVFVDGSLNTAITADGPRPDVGNVYGGSGRFGYSTQLAVPPGRHTVCTYAIDSTNGPSSLLSCRLIDNQPPEGSVDVVQLLRMSNGQVALRVVGWSADPDTTDPTQVHVYIDGRVTSNVRADWSRPDVGVALQRSQTQYGFDTAGPISPGEHTVCAYGIDTEGGQNTTLGCSHVTV